MSVVAGAIPVIVHTHVCCINKEPVATVVGKYIIVLQKANCYLGSFLLIVHTHVCCRSQELAVAVGVCGACACFCL